MQVTERSRIFLVSVHFRYSGCIVKKLFLAWCGGKTISVRPNWELNPRSRVFFIAWLVVLAFWAGRQWQHRLWGCLGNSASWVPFPVWPDISLVAFQFQFSSNACKRGHFNFCEREYVLSRFCFFKKKSYKNLPIIGEGRCIFLFAWPMC